MRRLSAIAALLALSTCGASLNFLRPGPQEFASTRICGVQVDGKTQTMHLRIELVPANALPRGAFVEVEFENPTEGGKALFAGRVITGEERTFAILSPPLKGVQPRGYETVARLYASSDKGKLLGTHTHMCQSLVDQRELRLPP